MEGHCATCTHWSQFLNGLDEPMDLGVCWLLSSHRGPSDAALASIVGDDPDLTADFQTMPEFGCVHWEKG